MKKVWHHFEKWEEIPAGMWRKVSSKEHGDFLKKAIEFTGSAKLYGEWMMKVLDMWPVSSEHNLTDENQNRQAWIGHAAACLAINCPEYIVREAWGQLTKQQQDEANEVADCAIEEFEFRHEFKNKSLHYQMELTGLSRWDSRRSSATIGGVEQNSVLSSNLPSHN